MYAKAFSSAVVRNVHVRTACVTYTDFVHVPLGDTTRITPSGIAKLQALGLKTDCDLRSKQQIEKAGGFKDLGEWGITRMWVPVFGEREYTEEKARERYEYYASEDTAVSRGACRCVH